MVTIAEIAKILKISKQSVWYILKRDKIKTRTFGSSRVAFLEKKDADKVVNNFKK